MSTTEAPENNEPGPLLGLGSGAGLGLLTERKIAECMLAVDDPVQWGRLGVGSGDMLKTFARAVERAAVAEYRRMEEVNRRHCEDDTELHRAALVRAEEAGYAKGLAALKSGWTFERNHNNCIVVRMPDGGGCVVDNVASDARMIPEEVLFALAVALGA